MAISASTPAPTSAPPYYRDSSNPAGSRHCLAPLLPRHRPQLPVVIQSSTVSNQIMSCGQRQPAISPQTSWTMGHARIITFSHTRQAPSFFPTNLNSTMTICPPTIHDPRQQLPTLHNATHFGYSGHSWPSMDGFSSSTPAQQGRLQIHSTLASPGQLSSLTQSSPTSRAPLPTALSHAPSADRGRRPTAGLPFPPAGWLLHPAISSNPSSPSNRVWARASWAITTSRPRHHSPVPEVGPSFDHYWSKRHVTERT